MWLCVPIKNVFHQICFHPMSRKISLIVFIVSMLLVFSIGKYFNPNDIFMPHIEYFKSLIISFAFPYGLHAFLNRLQTEHYVLTFIILVFGEFQWASDGIDINLIDMVLKVLGIAISFWVFRIFGISFSTK